MKKTFLISLSFIFLNISFLFGQENLADFDLKRYNFGFLIGFASGTAQPQLNPEPGMLDSLNYILPRFNPGISLGAISNLRVTKNIDLRMAHPTLAFVDRSLEFNMVNSTNNKVLKLESFYVQFPVAVKYKTDRLRNIRLYVLVGGKYGYDVLFNKRSKESVPINERLPVSLVAHTYDYEVAIGIDLYYPYFKFSPEIRFSNGLNNLLKPGDPNIYQDTISGIYSRVFTLNLHFE